MTHHKLDMGKAWTQATGLIGANRDTIGAIAGLFFFLPSFAASLLVPELSTGPQGGPQGSDPQAAMQAMMDQVSALYLDNWPLILVIFVAQFIGSLSLFALLSDRGNPTVAEALGTGVKSLPSYIAAQLLSVAGITFILAATTGAIGAFAPPAIAVLVAVAAILVAIWLFIRMSLITPVITIDGQRNPITAIARSWRLTKGNSLRILAFMVLLIITIGIISLLVSAILTLMLSAFGGLVASIGSGLVSAFVNSVTSVIFLVVIAAIHRQLSGGTPEGLAATFE